LVVADNPIGEWNSFYIRMIGDKVTVYLNGQLSTNNGIRTPLIGDPAFAGMEIQILDNEAPVYRNIMDRFTV
jgi:hypothetical protein